MNRMIEQQMKLNMNRNYLMMKERGMMPLYGEYGGDQSKQKLVEILDFIQREMREV